MRKLLTAAALSAGIVALEAEPTVAQSPGQEVNRMLSPVAEMTDKALDIVVPVAIGAGILLLATSGPDRPKKQ